MCDHPNSLKWKFSAQVLIQFFIHIQQLQDKFLLIPKPNFKKLVWDFLFHRVFEASPCNQ